MSNSRCSEQVATVAFWLTSERTDDHLQLAKPVAAVIAPVRFFQWRCGARSGSAWRLQPVKIEP
jgi:hypothetical protein